MTSANIYIYIYKYIYIYIYIYHSVRKYNKYLDINIEITCFLFPESGIYDIKERWSGCVNESESCLGYNIFSSS